MSHIFHLVVISYWYILHINNFICIFLKLTNHGVVLRKRKRKKFNISKWICLLAVVFVLNIVSCFGLQIIIFKSKIIVPFKLPRLQFIGSKQWHFFYLFQRFFNSCTLTFFFVMLCTGCYHFMFCNILL